MSAFIPPAFHAMRDPIPPPTMLIQLSQPLADKLGLKTMPYHVHEILLGFLAYHFILYGLSPAISRLICPKTYAGFNRRTQLNWDVHWVSMIQALFINAAALYVIFTDPERKEMDWKGRLWGYTPASGMVQGFAAGYFLWDFQICLQHFSICGVGALVHAIGALAITCIGFVRVHPLTGVKRAYLVLETIRELLWPVLYLVRIIHALSQRPLVLRQVGSYRIETPILQRRCAATHLLRLPCCLGNLPVDLDLLGHVQGSDDAGLPADESAPG